MLKFPSLELKNVVYIYIYIWIDPSRLKIDAKTNIKPLFSGSRRALSKQRFTAKIPYFPQKIVRIWRLTKTRIFRRRNHCVK